MFRNKTVFVLGAGASHEAGLPLGYQLAEKISELLNLDWNASGYCNGDIQVFQFLQSDPTLVNVARRMSKGIILSNSIDEYIDRHKDGEMQRIGKFAIALEILRGERTSNLYVDEDAGLRNVKVYGAWYIQLARALFPLYDIRRLDDLFANTSFIDFNYDRCLSQFLRFAIRDAYSTNAGRAESLIDKAILKPYGSLGVIRSTAQPKGMPFGQVRFQARFFDDIITRIKTYTEQVDTEAERQVKEEFASAHTVVFLGFGFHEQNMRLLAPPNETRIKRVLATAKHVSENDREIIKDMLRETCKSGFLSRKRPNDIIVRDLTCAELFKEYRLTLLAT